MGANAQTSVPTFTAGQVLTAAQLNQSARTGVPVAADSAARDGLFDGAGEKTLAEGQLVYLEDSNIVQYYDGSNWLTLGPASPGGLVYLTGATYTTVASVSLPNSTFTSTYANYKVIFVGTAVSTTLTHTMRMRASGSDDSTSNYSSGLYGITNNAALISVSNNNQTSWTLGGSDAGQQPLSFTIDVCNPEAAQKTRVVGVANTGPTGTNGYGGAVFGAFHNTTTQFDSMTLIASTGTISGFYRVYGYSDS